MPKAIRDRSEIHPWPGTPDELLESDRVLRYVFEVGGLDAVFDVAHLTAREASAYRLHLAGKSYRQIADELGLPSRWTPREFIRRARAKLVRATTHDDHNPSLRRLSQEVTD